MFVIKSILIIVGLIFVTACRDTTNIYQYYSTEQNCTSNQEDNNSSIEENNTSIIPLKNSLENIELYQPLLKQVNGSRQYYIDKLDATSNYLLPFSFNFDIKDFEALTEEQEIFIDGKQNAFSNIEYKIDATGKLVAYLGTQEIYTLSLLSTHDINNTWIEGYRTNIDTTGKAYTIEKEYLSNFYIIEKLVTSDVFETLEEFTQKYQNKVFLGDYFRGLTFATNNKLEESKDKNSTTAGTYEIKTIDEQNVLMIYPDDSQYYYADDSCYILNFSRVWKAKCYFKTSKKEELFYDKDAYDDFLFYLQTKFTQVTVSI